MKKSILWTLVIALMFTASAIYAQDDTTAEDPNESYYFEIEGILTITEDGDIMIGDTIIAPAGSFNPSDYETGDHVIVVGVLLNDNTVQAISLKEVDEDEIIDEEPGEVTEETGDDMSEEDEGEDEVETTGPHPVASAIATQFNLEYDEVFGWHADGLGFGNIAKAMILADQLEDLEPEDAIQLLLDGTNLNQYARENGLSPSDLAPGRVISGRYTSPSADEMGYVNTGVNVNIRTGASTDSDIIGTLQPGMTFVIIGIEDGWYIVQLEDGTIAYIFGDLVGEGEVPEEMIGTAPNQGQSGEGLNKFGCDGRGNSCNAPGQNKDKGDKKNK